MLKWDRTMEQTRRYPIGVQTFEKIREGGFLYIDKTALVYDLVTSNTIYFLGRPRRFGKSLLVTTLEAYFSGKKELFRGLAMESLEKDWTEYPVLHFDFSGTKYFSTDDLSEQLDIQLSRMEEKYGILMTCPSSWTSSCHAWRRNTGKAKAK